MCMEGLADGAVRPATSRAMRCFVKVRGPVFLTGRSRGSGRVNEI
jgi:hypothetical protein